jgi:uncharacterized protein YdhG (YjbR/CyaY superfamily)
MKKYASVDAYIGSFPKDVQVKLKQLRVLIRKAAPRAAEGMSYGLPGYKLNGPLVYFGAFKKHVSFFPASGNIREAFSKQLAVYKGGRGTIQFPLEKTLPLSLIRKIVAHRVRQNTLAAAKRR